MSDVTYDHLVDGGRVHSHMFTDPKVFAAEIQRIFHSWWLYVGHSSEVPEPGDYALKRMGRQSVIMSRDADGNLHLLLNRCRHRGNTVCQAPRGNSKFFRCHYHGWTFKNDGRLTGVPYPKGYDDDFDKADHGLTPVPHVGEYRGFVFASLGDTGVPFEEYLTPRVRGVIDDFVKASPSESIRLQAGASSHSYAGNWKFVGMDGYHPAFVHAGIEDILRERGASSSILRDAYSEGSPNLSWDFGQGHSRLDHGPSKGAVLNKLVDKLSNTDAGKRYLDRLRETYGDRVEEVLEEAADPHLGIWPNMQLVGSHIRVIHPVAPDLTEVETFPTLLDDVPDEVNENRVRGHEWFYGAAGFGTPDDYEIFERNQAGLLCDVDPWLILTRGLNREVHHDDGAISGNITDEVPQRGMTRQWLHVMNRGTGIASDRAGAGPNSVSAGSR